MTQTPAFIIAGTHSGAGKTTTCNIVMSLLTEEGYRVQPFKHGPDFIDPGYHKASTGNESINLDFWMMGKNEISKSFESYLKQSDIGIVEGMGALFDGENGTEKGSGAELAHFLSLKIILVVDAFGMTRSVNALLKGFLEFDSNIKISGVIFNRVGSKKHYDMIYRSLVPEYQALSLGYILFTSDLEIKERHLGLTTIEENSSFKENLNHVLKDSRNTLNLSAITANISKKTFSFPVKKEKARLHLGVAKDKAFCFYYRENLLSLEETGIKITYFSPLRDNKIPADVDGLYFGGGYPELFAKELSENHSFIESLRLSAKNGLPIYAECGGFIYLSKSIQNDYHVTYPLVGIFPYEILWDKTYLAIRYVEVETLQETWFGPEGTIIRGQEFHQTRIRNDANENESVFKVKSSSGEEFMHGIKKYNVLGSYFHLNFAKLALNIKKYIECPKNIFF